MREESTHGHDCVSMQYAIVEDNGNDIYYRVKCLEFERGVFDSLLSLR